MSEKLSKRERVEAALAGEAVDRVPVAPGAISSPRRGISMRSPKPR